MKNYKVKDSQLYNKWKSSNKEENKIMQKGDISGKVVIETNETKESFQDLWKEFFQYL